MESKSARAPDIASLEGQPDKQHAIGHHRRLRRGMLGTLAFAAGLCVYTLVQSASLPIYSAETPWDAAIPLIPGFIFVYWMFFPFVVAAAFVSRAEDFLRIVIGALLAAVVGWLCFLFFPASLARPDPATLEPGVAQWLFSLLHWIDDSHNTFPSLHVSTTWISLLAFREKSYRWPAVAMAFLIVLSTLLVKQHSVLDVAGGTVLAVLVVPAASALSDRLIQAFPNLSEL